MKDIVSISGKFTDGQQTILIQCGKIEAAEDRCRREVPNPVCSRKYGKGNLLEKWHLGWVELDAADLEKGIYKLLENLMCKLCIVYGKE